MIVDDGRMTKLTIHNVARPVNPLSTTPPGHLANSMPIVPSELTQPWPTASTNVPIQAS